MSAWIQFSFRTPRSQRDCDFHPVTVDAADLYLDIRRYLEVAPLVAACLSEFGFLSDCGGESR